MRLALLLIGLFPLNLSAQINNFQWPIASVDQQHRISATFDEFRDTEPSDHFHNGTDMPLTAGGNVLSIMAGLVTDKGSDWIRVEDFAYVHVIPLTGLDIGQTVSKSAVVGHTDSYAHIHLNYGGGASGHPLGNPLLPGKITPFTDPYHPRSPIIEFVKDGTFTKFPTNALSGRVDIIAQAADTTDLLSSIDKNNGVYKIGWALYSEDKNSVVEGPYYWFEANAYYSNSYVHNRYAPGSTTSIYKHIVTNRPSSNGYLDCTIHPPGNYNIAVFSVDTRNNWDTTFVPVRLSDQDLLPPGQPILNFVGGIEGGGLRIDWTPPTASDLAGYILEFSFGDGNWSSNHGPDILTPDLTSYTITGFPLGEYVEFRLAAVDSASIPNRSEYSDTYPVIIRGGVGAMLIVDGFDRITGSWTKNQHDFATYYAKAIANAIDWAAITTVSNEWVTAGGELGNYYKVFWFMGDDSRTDESFSSAEQTIIKAYLANGGGLFASGSEIAYDLSAGTQVDIDFMQQTLHIDYAGDDAANLHVNGFEFYFSGLSFNYGAAPYLEDWPDHFYTSNDGEVILKYGNNLVAGVGYKPTVKAETMVLGFPFETIDTEESRTALMKKSLSYFDIPSDINGIQVPVTSSISAIYPNLFNASVNIRYQLGQSSESSITIFDIRGKLVYEEHWAMQDVGEHSWQWNARDSQGRPMASGAYILRITPNSGKVLSGKLLLLK